MIPLNKISLPDTSRNRWGNWHLKRDTWELEYVRHFPNRHAIYYWINLEEINTCGAMLDWVFQLSSKTWMSLEDRADLIEAFREIFDPQANLCSFRGNREIDAPRYLRERYKELP
jgi:hypothetical protein